MKAKLAETVDEVNRDQAARIVKMIEKISLESGKIKSKIKISVLGLSYKPNTPIIEDSQAIDIVENLINKGYNVIVYDPQAMYFARGVFGDEVKYAKSSSECIEKSQIVVIVTPWKEFSKINSKNLRNKKLVILDCWGILKDKNLNIKYLGRGI